MAQLLSPLQVADDMVVNEFTSLPAMWRANEGAISSDATRLLAELRRREETLCDDGFVGGIRFFVHYDELVERTFNFETRRPEYLVR